jgi:hypothetical protein
VSVAANTGFVSERFLKALAEDDSGVFDGVVEVDFDITIDLNIQIDEGMT